MTQKEKGYVGLGLMVVLAAGTVLGSDPLYKAIDRASTPKVSYTAGTYTGTGAGFGGDVVATVVVGDNGIESVTLQGDNETPGLGADALKPLEEQFMASGSATVDGVSGCTLTSNGARDAVQQALDQASGKIEVIAAGDSTADEKKEETTEAAKETTEAAKEESKAADAAAASYKAGTYEGSAQGFGGEIKAVVTITDNGIESVELTGDGETPALGGEALKELPDQFVKAQSAEVDGVSGCTVTSTGAKEAVANALSQAQ